jgi:hypothetical protein
MSDMNSDKFPVRGREYGIVSFDAACQFLREGM